MIEYLATALIFAFAGVLQGVSGFGSLLFAIPLLALYLPPQVCVPVSALCGIFIVTVLGLNLRRHLDRTKILPILLGSLPGVGIGVALLKHVDAHTFRLLLGSMLTAYALFALLARPRPRRLHRSWGALAGALAGAIAAAFSAGGPPVIVYTTLQDWTPDQKRATLTGFFWAVGILVASTHALAGLTTGYVLAHAAAAVPAIYLGVHAGLRLSSRIGPVAYVLFVQMLLLAMGLMLLFN
jgi:hypothetical protein